MIAYIVGRLAEKSMDYIVLEQQGIGYLIYVPSMMIQNLPPIGEQVKVYTYMYVREDLITLYGFGSRDELEFFKLLIGVSGIGPKGALAILSTSSVEQLKVAIVSGDTKTISKAPGVGAKTAQRLIIEIKDKIDLESVFSDQSEQSYSETGSNDSGARKEAIMALVALGYSESEAFSALRKIECPPDMDSEMLLKLALKQMLV